MNPLLRRALLFVAAVLVLYAIFYLFAPRAAYAAFYRGTCNLAYEWCGNDRTARFTPFDDPKGQFDSRVEIGLRSRRVYPAGLPLDTFRQGYIPTALFAALVLASPVGWRRRGRALAIGLPLITVYAVACSALSLAQGFAMVPINGRPLWEAPPWFVDVIARLEQLLVGDLSAAYLAPLMLWLMVMVRQDDLQDLSGPSVRES